MASFTLRSVNLQGANNTALLTNATQEMTHARINHAGTKITFTRYWNFINGLATEGGGYNNTEICQVNVDGTGLQVLVAHQAGVIAAGSSYLPDDSGVTFASTAAGYLQPMVYTFSDGQVHTLPFPAGVNCSDPHYEGPCSQIVFTEPPTGNTQQPVWTMFADGSGLRQLTFPALQPTGTPAPGLSYGDYDPRLTQDGSKVTWMRYFGGNDWRAHVKSIRGTVESDLTTNQYIDLEPDWSGDGQLLAVQTFSLNLLVQGILTMNADGSNRTMIPNLPAATTYSHPSFYLLEGSNPATRVLYSQRVG